MGAVVNGVRSVDAIAARKNSPGVYLQKPQDRWRVTPRQEDPEHNDPQYQRPARQARPRLATQECHSTRRS